MFHALRLAYISIVIAVQDASEAASSSCGLGPRSSPPDPSGSSAVRWCWRTLRSCVKFSRWRATAIMAESLGERVEQLAREHLGEEVGGLRRHVHARRRDVADVLDGGRAHKERGLRLAGLDPGTGLLGVARVVEP